MTNMLFLQLVKCAGLSAYQFIACANRIPLATLPSQMISGAALDFTATLPPLPLVISRESSSRVYTYVRYFW